MSSYFSKFSESVFFNVLCAWNSLITVILLRLFSQEIKACPGPPPPEPDKSVAIPYPTYPPRDIKALVEPLPDIPPCCLLQLHTSPIYQLPSAFWKGVPFFQKKKKTAKLPFTWFLQSIVLFHPWCSSLRFENP
jgi:hypothetical protein